MTFLGLGGLFGSTVLIMKAGQFAFDYRLSDLSLSTNRAGSDCKLRQTVKYNIF